MKTIKYIFYALLIILLFNSCADVSMVDECTTNEPYGFWSGVWHGFIILFSWIGSLFSDNIAIYAVNNNGGWYDSGFVIGTVFLVGSINKS